MMPAIVRKSVLSGTVAADHPEPVAGRQAQADVFQRPEARAADAQLRIEGNADVFQLDDRLTHVGSFT